MFRIIPRILHLKMNIEYTLRLCSYTSLLLVHFLEFSINKSMKVDSINIPMCVERFVILIGLPLFFQLEAFICPWSSLANYSHSQNEIDQVFDDLMNPLELSDANFALYINKIHYLNATKRYEKLNGNGQSDLLFSRFDQSKVYTETLLEAFPYSIELWIELLLNPGVSENMTEVNGREMIE